MENVLFGSYNHSGNDENKFDLIHFIVIMAKFHIKKCIYTNSKPFFLALVNQIKMCICTVSVKQELLKHLTLVWPLTLHDQYVIYPLATLWVCMGVCIIVSLQHGRVPSFII